MDKNGENGWMKLTNAVKSKNITQRDSENWKSPHEYNDASMFHFRDEKRNEAEELLKLKSIMEREGDNPPKILCVICGMRPDGVYVVPITALKP